MSDQDLIIRDLHVAPTVNPDHEILKGIDLTVSKGEVHAIMGPNGSGKTTLAYALMGHPAYTIKSGEVLWQGHNVLKLSADKRARLGMFLAFQYPMAIPGLSVASFLRSAINARRPGLTPDPNVDPTDAFKGGIPMGEFRKLDAREDGPAQDGRVHSPLATSTRVSPAARRSASRCSRWRCCEPEMAILDETDSGLDIDALRIVAEGVNAMLNPNMGVLLITHYQRLLNYITPDNVHVLAAGRISHQRRQGPRPAPRGGGLRPDPAPRPASNGRHR